MSLCVFLRCLLYTYSICPSSFREILIVLRPRSRMCNAQLLYKTKKTTSIVNETLSFTFLFSSFQKNNKIIKKNRLSFLLLLSFFVFCLFLLLLLFIRVFSFLFFSSKRVPSSHMRCSSTTFISCTNRFVLLLLFFLSLRAKRKTKKSI